MLAAKFIAIGGTLETLNEYLDALATVTPRDIAAAARLYLTPTRRFIVTLAPQVASASSTEGDAQ